ncbi:MAG: DUF2330 domain-containing protein [Candidatus Sericytochromatia bacterium]
MNLFLAGILLPATSALACGLASRGYTSTMAEEAVIVWNPATKVEHFIRRAQFATEDKDIGFLVPTPSVPQLGEVDQTVFERLLKEIQPRKKVVYQVIPAVMLWLALPNFIGSQDRAKTAAFELVQVQVLQQTLVAGYQASVLKAADPQAVLGWLKQNGYPVRPGLKAWLEPYLRQRWIITAFRLAKPAAQAKDDSELNFKAVDLRFVTERPFYPYREPVDERPADAPLGAARSLRIYFIGPGPVNGDFNPEGTLLQGGEAQDRELISVERSTRLYSAPLATEQRQSLLVGAVPPSDLPAESWLTAWADLSDQRADPTAGKPELLSELYFYPAKGTPDIPEKVIKKNIVLPLDFALAGWAGYGFWRWRKRRKKGRGS